MSTRNADRLHDHLSVHPPGTRVNVKGTARIAGVPKGSVSLAVSQLIGEGRFPWLVATGRPAQTTRAAKLGPAVGSAAERAAQSEAKLVAAALTLVGRRSVNYSEMARAAGLSNYAARTGTDRLRAKGEWPYQWPTNGSQGGGKKAARPIARPSNWAIERGLVPTIKASVGVVRLRLHGIDRVQSVDPDRAREFCAAILAAWPDSRAAWKTIEDKSTMPMMAAADDDEEAA